MCVSTGNLNPSGQCGQCFYVQHFDFVSVCRFQGNETERMFQNHYPRVLKFNPVIVVSVNAAVTTGTLCIRAMGPRFPREHMKSRLDLQYDHVNPTWSVQNSPQGSVGFPWDLRASFFVSFCSYRIVYFVWVGAAVSPVAAGKHSGPPPSFCGKDRDQGQRKRCNNTVAFLLM